MKDRGDLEFMKHAKDWPLWPGLPLKNSRKKHERGWPLFGFLVDTNPLDTLDPEPEPKVYIGLLGTKYERIEEYDSLEAIVADGWVVD